jgi:superfamily II DNA helicase RecQ
MWKLKRLVVDVTHSVSALGDDFRPEYEQLSMLRDMFSNVPIRALPATVEYPS